MNLIRMLIVLEILQIASCRQGTDSRHGTKDFSASPSIIKTNTIDVSLIRLIATPEKFDGKKVRVKGFLNLEFEGTAIFLNKEDSENYIPKNAIWIDVSKKFIYAVHSSILNQRYVVLEGVFDVNNLGHESTYSGGIKNISKIKLLDK